MKFTLSWLRAHLDTDADLDRLTDSLTHLGLEVEQVIDRAAELAAFRVGEVIECGSHPQADRLSLCQIADGSGETQPVVCGAPNVRAGMKAVFAPPGAVIPATGARLGKARIRGVESRGMLCSEAELGLSAESEGIIELPARAETGSPAAAALGLDDPLIEIDLTPDRGDCASVRGIARDLAAAGLGRLCPLGIEPVEGRYASPLSVTLDLPAGLSGPESFYGDEHPPAPLFVGRHIRGVRNGESPAWLRARLESVGLKPVSAQFPDPGYGPAPPCL